MRKNVARAWRSVVLWRVLNTVLALAVVAGLAAGGFLGYRWLERDKLDGARAGAVAAARQTVVNFVSISAASVDRDIQRIADGATGDFKEEFSRGMQQVRSAVLENKVESQGTVLSHGVLSSDRDSATVLLAVDATVKNVRAPNGRLTHYRFQVDVALERGDWRVARLQFVG